jgi:predicted amidohydrolase
LDTIKIAIVLLTLIVVAIFSCNAMGGREIKPVTEETPIAIDVLGVNHGRGNIIGVQPCVSPTDYADKERFFMAMDRYLRAASQKGWLNPKTIVIFPEYIGTWLLVANEDNAVYTTKTTSEVISSLAWRHPLAFIEKLFEAARYANDNIRYSAFTIKAQQTAQIYHEVFSRLAKQYQVTIAAGSILLPGPEIEAGQLKTADGPLYNVTVVYKPDGTPYDKIVRKAYITSFEASFTAAGNPEDLPVFNTPAGKVGVLICADAWYPLAYSVLRRQRADLILVPSFKTLAGRLDRLWDGYNNHPAPLDVDPNDIGTITEEQAMLKYSLAGRMKSAGAKYGMNVFLRGALWDMDTDGYTITVEQDQVFEGEYHSGAALYNQWLQ